jgi:hypothetical protein
MKRATFLSITSVLTRLICSAVALFYLLMAVGSTVESVRAGWGWSFESTVVAASISAFAIGAGISWRREVLGGVIVALAALPWMALHIAQPRPAGEALVIAAPLLIPGLLVVLTGWLKTRTSTPVANKLGEWGNLV